jgi:hypothetical protein
LPWKWEERDRKEWDDTERSLQMEWVRTVPGYKEVLKQRVSEARKQQMMKDRLVYNGVRRRRGDFDRLGREVEGCG